MCATLVREIPDPLYQKLVVHPFLPMHRTLRSSLSTGGKTVKEQTRRKGEQNSLSSSKDSESDSTSDVNNFLRL